MRLVSFQRSDAAPVEAGVVAGERVLPARRLVDVAHSATDLDTGTRLRSADPLTMDVLLDGFARHRPLLDAGLEEVGEGEGLDRDAIRARAPVPEPPSVRDFYAFEEHVARSWERRGEPVPDAWYEVPVFYFSNPASIHGPGEPVARPSATRALDFELEVAWVLGEPACDLEPEQAWDAIAGLAILDDFSARDVQREEMAVGLGPSKGKDFATALGPAIVTLDELEDAREGEHLDLAMRARVNGELVSEGSLADLHYSIPEMLAHASRDTRVRPGAVMGTGTVGTGSILDLGTDDWLEPGDVARLEVEGLGALENEVVAPGGSHRKST